MARQICITVPEPPISPLSITVPGVGEVQSVRDFALAAYDVCQDARAFIQGIQPIFAALGMPLCILGCLSAVTKVFKPDSFPFVDPAAMLDVVPSCACLASFTPFGFCGMLRGIINAVYSLLSCIIGLLGDIARLEAQVAALASDPTTLFTAQCLNTSNERLLANIQSSFGAVTVLFDSAEFLFEFVGIPFTSLGSLSGGSASEVLSAATAVQEALGVILVTLNGICPP